MFPNIRNVSNLQLETDSFNGLLVKLSELWCLPNSSIHEKEPLVSFQLISSTNSSKLSPIVIDAKFGPFSYIGSCGRPATSRKSTLTTRYWALSIDLSAISIFRRRRTICSFSCLLTAWTRTWRCFNSFTWWITFSSVFKIEL